MTKILKSLLVLGIIGGVGLTVAKSGAWFTDQEVLGDNTVSTGTIDIAIDGENPVNVNKHYDLVDLKPSQHGYIDEIINNVGSNPANVYKTVGEFVESELLQSEPKCFAIGGQWGWSEEGQKNICTGGVLPTDLASRINYDLRVELYNGDPKTATRIWWETIYLDSDNVKLGQLDKVYLGMIPAGWSMKVMQSYHMVSSDEGDNKYQGEKLTFDMTFDAEQLGASPLPLVHKYLSDTDVSHHVYDSQGAVLSYTIRDRAFDYTLTTTGLPAGPYTLIAWDDSANNYAFDFSNRGNAIVLAHVNANGTATGSIDIDRNLKNAKAWLLVGSIGTVGSPVGSFAWNSTGTVFETGLMDYYDADHM